MFYVTKQNQIRNHISVLYCLIGTMLVLIFFSIPSKFLWRHSMPLQWDEVMEIWQSKTFWFLSWIENDQKKFLGQIIAYHH